MMFRKALSTTTELVQSLTKAAIPAATAYLCYENIQTLRKVDEPIKNDLKDQASLTSSTVSALALGVSGLGLISKLIETGAWAKLSRTQQAAIVLSTISYLAGAGYSMSRFGIEHNTLWAGISASAGVFAGEGAKHLLSFFAKGEEATPVESYTDTPNNMEDGYDTENTDRLQSLTTHRHNN